MGRIYYPFHPRRGETVLIQRRYAYRGAELVVIPQPDGSVACIPAWMTLETAAHHRLCDAPQFSLEILRTLRCAMDALLGSLHSDSGVENASHEAQLHNVSARPVRSKDDAHHHADGRPDGAVGEVGGGVVTRDRRSSRRRGGRE